MKNWFLVCLCLGIIAMISACCKNDQIISTTDSLNRLNWEARNYEVLDQLIRNYGVNGKFYDKNKSPYVVLDWDQTCAHFDTEEALLHYQLSNLKFRITPEQFSTILKPDINGVTNLSDGFQNILLSDINEDLINDYNFLYDNYSGFNGSLSLEEIKLTNPYIDFIAKLPYLYNGYCSTPGIEAEYGYPWVLYLLSGYTTVEIKALAREAISYELSNKLSKVTWQSPSNFPANISGVMYSYRSGLRIFPEMQDLIATFEEHGIEVYIVSASYKPVVEAFAGVGAFGYNVPDENIIAMELETANNVILPVYKTGWVKTYRQGKVEAINRIIKTGLGKNWDPLFSAGDSDGDYEMMTGFTGMKLALIWNRVKGGDIGKISLQAMDEINNPEPRFILQGRNENTGIVLPSSSSILFGKTEPQLLYP